MSKRQSLIQKNNRRRKRGLKPKKSRNFNGELAQSSGARSLRRSRSQTTPGELAHGI